MVQAKRMRRLSLLLIAVAAVTVAVLSAFAWWTVLSATRQGEANVRQTAALLAEHTNGVLESAELILTEVADRVGARPWPDVETDLAFNGWMRAVAGHKKEISSLLVIDEEGAVRQTSLTLDEAPANLRDQEYFKRLSEGKGDVFIDGPFNSKLTGRKIFMISKRLSRTDGGFRGVAQIAVPVAYFSDYWGRLGPDGEFVLSLVRDDGKSIVRYPPADPEHFATPNQRLLQAMARARSGGYHDNPISDADPRIVGYAHLERFPITVVYRLKASAVLMGWWTTSGLIAMAAGALLVSTLGLGLVVQRQIRIDAATRHRLADSEARYRVVAEHSNDAIVRFTLDGERLYVSPSIERMTGWTAQEFLAATYRDHCHPDDMTAFDAVVGPLRLGQRETVVEWRYRTRDGRYIWVEGRASLIGNSTGGPTGGPADGPPQVLTNIRDITRQKEAEQKLEEANRRLQALASTDPLSGLANRRQFDLVFAQEWARAKRDHQSLALLLLDLDRFKKLNDTHGHQVGDACITAVAAAMGGALMRGGDFLARYGGEEFLALLPATDRRGAMHIAEKLRAAVEALAVPTPEGSQVRLTISIGVATAMPQDGADPDTLMRQADGALYAAKRSGRNRVVHVCEQVAVAVA